MRLKLTSDFTTKDALLGVLFGLFFSSHALRTVIHIDFHSILAATALLMVIGGNIAILKSSIFVKPPLYETLVTLSLALYILIQMLLAGNLIKGLEIISIGSLLLLPRLITRQEIFIAALKNLCIFSVGLQSILLIVNKTHIYSFGLNYLLIAALTPVVTCYLYYKAWTVHNRIQRSLYLFSAVFTLIALLEVQGRFSLLLCMSGILLLTAYYLQRIVTTIEGILLMSVASFLLHDVIIYLQKAPAIIRTLSLIQSGQTLDRILILQTYITALKGNWITGFGLGQTPIFPPYYYPHNFILEFITEYGIIGGKFILLLTLSTIWRIKQISFKNCDQAFIAFLLLNYLLFFLKSGSIYDSFALFAAFGVIKSYRFDNER